MYCSVLSISGLQQTDRQSIAQHISKQVLYRGADKLKNVSIWQKIKKCKNEILYFFRDSVPLKWTVECVMANYSYFKEIVSQEKTNWFFIFPIPCSHGFWNRIYLTGPETKA